MTYREKWRRLFRGKPIDRVPFAMVMGVSRQTLERWSHEGFPMVVEPGNMEHVRDAHLKLLEMFGFEMRRGSFLPVNAFVYPEYDEVVVDHRDGYDYVKTKWGGVKRVPVNPVGRMALQETPPVTDRQSWEGIKERLVPDTAGRFPKDWQEITKAARESDLPIYSGDLPIGFFGGPRELVGTEGMCTLMYDDPDLVREILDTLCDLWIELYTRAHRDAPLDYFFIWEDMCYKNGPLISPAQFGEFLLPRYKRFIAALKDIGDPLIMVDSDGDTRKLVPLWREAGVDITFPWETQYGLDIRTVRKSYPKIGIIGGLNKSALAYGKDAIDEQLERAEWMIREGRCIPWLDHEVPPEVPWEAFEYFCRRLKEIVDTTEPKASE